MTIEFTDNGIYGQNRMQISGSFGFRVLRLSAGRINFAANLQQPLNERSLFHGKTEKLPEFIIAKKFTQPITQPT